jgi:hypothetical protein
MVAAIRLILNTLQLPAMHRTGRLMLPLLRPHIASVCQAALIEPTVNIKLCLRQAVI